MTTIITAAIRAAADLYGIAPADIRSRARSRKIADARAVAQWLVRRLTPLSYPEIGRAFARHHTTVLIAVRRAKAEHLIPEALREITAGELLHEWGEPEPVAPPEPEPEVVTGFCAVCLREEQLRHGEIDGRVYVVCAPCEEESPRSGRYSFSDDGGSDDQLTLSRFSRSKSGAQ